MMVFGLSQQSFSISVIVPSPFKKYLVRSGTCKRVQKLKKAHPLTGISQIEKIIWRSPVNKKKFDKEEIIRIVFK